MPHEMRTTFPASPGFPNHKWQERIADENDLVVSDQKERKRDLQDEA